MLCTRYVQVTCYLPNESLKDVVWFIQLLTILTGIIAELIFYKSKMCGSEQLNKVTVTEHRTPSSL